MCIVNPVKYCNEVMFFDYHALCVVCLLILLNLPIIKGDSDVFIVYTNSILFKVLEVFFQVK